MNISRVGRLKRPPELVGTGTLDDVMFCANCNENLDTVPVADPCPRCGGPRRSAVVHPQTARAVSVANPGSIKITRGDARPWNEKWMTVMYLFDSVKAAYADPSRTIGNREVEHRVESFFAECHHFPEWLNGDRANLPQQVLSAALDGHARDPRRHRG